MEHQIASCLQRGHRPLAKISINRIKRVHGNIVAKQQSLESDVFANHVLDQPRRNGRRRGAVDIGVADMRSHRQRHVAEFPKWQKVRCNELGLTEVNSGQGLMAIDLCVPMTGNVL